MKARIVYMGTPEFAVPALKKLLESDDLEVGGVFTQPDRPAGRGRKLTASPVKEVALEAGVPVETPRKMRAPETQQRLASWEADLAVVAAYGRILPESLLQTPRLGCINIHASLLPRHRGASPIAHAILEGDKETGVSIMQMDAGLDTGPVYATRKVAITDQTCDELTDTLSEMGGELLLEVLPDILAGNIKPTPQPRQGETYARLLTKQDGKLDFTQPAVEIERRVRAMTPWPGAFTFKGDQRIVIESAKAIAHAAKGTPGDVVKVAPEGVDVCTGDGLLRITHVKPAGKKSMNVQAWISGRSVASGDHFG